ncbi:MAG: hypothetical protein P9M11_06935 [Candidatus Tenebribacter burtonii]|nr:hypothetical protein [Candidatus Tenebribacter burtonii]
MKVLAFAASSSTRSINKKLVTYALSFSRSMLNISRKTGIAMIV